MRFIARFVVKVINWDGEIVGWVEERRINVVTLG